MTADRNFRSFRLPEKDLERDNVGLFSCLPVRAETSFSLFLPREKDVDRQILCCPVLGVPFSCSFTAVTSGRGWASLPLLLWSTFFALSCDFRMCCAKSSTMAGHRRVLYHSGARKDEIQIGFIKKCVVLTTVVQILSQASEKLPTNEGNSPRTARGLSRTSKSRRPIHNPFQCPFCCITARRRVARNFDFFKMLFK